MVNRNRVKRFIPIILTNGKTTERIGMNEYMKKRRAFIRLPRMERDRMVTECVLLFAKIEKQLLEQTK